MTFPIKAEKIDDSLAAASRHRRAADVLDIEPCRQRLQGAEKRGDDVRVAGIPLTVLRSRLLSRSDDNGALWIRHRSGFAGQLPRGRCRGQDLHSVANILRII